jgi:alkylated DNA repair dioxygenase AlkB
MKAFEDDIDKTRNWIPGEGTVNYYGRVFNPRIADSYLDKLLTTIQWRHDEAVIFGRTITTKLQVAWYGEKPFSYTYSGTTKYALPWTLELLGIKSEVERLSRETFNSCLINLYHDGTEGMAWHSDGEKDLKKNGAIASVSFGAERKFAFRHKTTGEKVELWLEHGSLLVMKDTTQTHWLHRLPPAARVRTPRISLTFRTIVR